MTSRLTLVTAVDCHLCGHARSVAHRLAADLKVEIQEIAWESTEADVVRRDGVPFPPALYAGDDLLGYGRISEGGVRLRARGHFIDQRYFDLNAGFSIAPPVG